VAGCVVGVCIRRVEKWRGKTVARSWSAFTWGMLCPVFLMHALCEQYSQKWFLSA